MGRAQSDRKWHSISWHEKYVVYILTPKQPQKKEWLKHSRLIRQKT